MTGTRENKPEILKILSYYRDLTEFIKASGEVDRKRNDCATINTLSIITLPVSNNGAGQTTILVFEQQESGMVHIHT